MIVQIKINGETYPAIIDGKVSDPTWDGRRTQEITVEMTYQEAAEIFVDGVEWSVIFQGEDPDTHQISTVEEDRSEYCLAGDLTDHRDGTISAKMGKETDLEEILEMLYGGDEK